VSRGFGPGHDLLTLVRMLGWYEEGGDKRCDNSFRRYWKLDYGTEVHAMRKLVIVLLLITGASHAGDFEVGINGVNLQGRPCAGLGSGSGGIRHQQIVAVGYDAMEIIVHSERMVSGIDGAGRSHFVGSYRGNRLTKLRGKTFSCHVSLDARQTR
jgi:hypothetical protein